MEVNPALLIPAVFAGTFVLLLVLALVFNKPHLWFFVFIVCLPLEIIAVEDDVLSLPKMLGIVALTSWLISCVKNKKNIYVDKAATFLLIFILLGIMSYFWSIYQEKTLVSISTYILLLILYVMTINLVTSNKAIDIVMFALVACGILILLYSLIKMEIDILILTERLAGITDNANMTAIWIIATLPGFYYIFTKYKSILLRGMILCTLIGLLYILTLTESRGGLISLFAFLGLPFIYKIGKTKVLVVLVAISAIIYFTAPEILWSRFEKIGSEGQTDRIDVLWPAGLQAVVGSPIIGYGLGTNGRVIQPLTGLSGMKQDLPVHCGPLAVTIELGVIGLIFYMLFLFIPIKEIMQRLRSAQKVRRSSKVAYTLNVLLFAALGAIIVTWLKGGGMEYSKLLFLYIGLTISISRVSFSREYNYALNKKMVPFGMQFRPPVALGSKPFPLPAITSK